MDDKELQEELNEAKTLQRLGFTPRRTPKSSEWDKVLVPLPYDEQFWACIAFMIGLPFAMLLGNVSEFRKHLLDLTHIRRVELTIQKRRAEKWATASASQTQK